MSFFDKSEIDALVEQKQREEAKARKAALDKQAAEERMAALRQREVATLIPHVREALGEFVGLAKQLGTKSSTIMARRKTPFGDKTKYGRQKIVHDVTVWDLFYANWSDGNGTVLVDDHGRTYVSDYTVKVTWVNPSCVYQIPQESAVEMMAESIRNTYYSKNRECPEGSLLDNQRAKDAVQSAFMEALKRK